MLHRWPTGPSECSSPELRSVFETSRLQVRSAWLADLNPSIRRIGNLIWMNCQDTSNSASYSFSGFDQVKGEGRVNSLVSETVQSHEGGFLVAPPVV